MKCKLLFTIMLSFLLVPVFLQCGDLHSKGPSDLRLKKIVIDPGHGGKDAGAVSKDKKTYEKTLTLKISTLLKNKIEAAYPDVEVILTRSKDVYLTLNERAEIANKNDADLFVSIHINSVSSANADGFSTHILGQSSNKNKDLFSEHMEVCKRENSVILLEEDYSTNYQGFDPNDPESFIFFKLMQNAFYEQSLLFAEQCDIHMSKGPVKRSRGVSQDPFYVLWKTTMPSVLIEAGFLSNPSDLAVMRSASGIDGIAEAIFKAFCEFKKMYDTSLESEHEVQTHEPAPAVKSDSVLYGTQVLVSGRDIKESDPLFKGYRCVKIKSGNLFKYIIGVSEQEQMAKKMHTDIKQHFPDAFMVTLEGGTVERYK